jgi:hypothetical protein
MEDFLPSFARGENGRILCIVAPVIADAETFGFPATGERLSLVREVLSYYQAVLNRARRAIACWSVVGLRCGAAKDVRVMIAKMAWEELWLWSTN